MNAEKIEKLLKYRNCSGQLRVLYDCQKAPETLDWKELEAKRLGLCEYFELIPVMERITWFPILKVAGFKTGYDGPCNWMQIAICMMLEA